MIILITGTAGFIGSNLCMRLLKDQDDTQVIDLYLSKEALPTRSLLMIFSINTSLK